jgi:benzoyl-CoA reductase/2-hydroxyglutaryl-CoA dehydratase subunit BcrC/BadD/HgdB
MNGKTRDLREEKMVSKSEFDSKNWRLHQNALLETVNQLEASWCAYEYSGYFFNLARKYSLELRKKRDKPQVAVLGLNIPEELIYALGAEPLWILGGSFGAAQYGDLLVPRDTDSVSKAGLGYLITDSFTFTKEAVLTIVPITSDSMRKIAYLLSREREVLTVDFPPVKEEGIALKKWLTQMKVLTWLLERKTQKRLNKKGLIAAIDMVNQAKLEMKRLLSFGSTNPELLSGAMAAFIINTYYFTGDPNEWTAHLKALSDELERKAKQQSGWVQKKRPRLLIAGSPVFFPNFKLPLLLQELDVFEIAIGHELTFRIENIVKIPHPNASLTSVFESLVCNCYLKDTSAAFADSKSRMDLLQELEKAHSFNGVIYHVLKGQIEYDFELERCESYFAQKDIPFFRLETDYHRQDLEQLKIRLEAFLEMIEAKYFKMRA